MRVAFTAVRFVGFRVEILRFVIVALVSVAFSVVKLLEFKFVADAFVAKVLLDVEFVRVAFVATRLSVFVVEALVVEAFRICRFPLVPNKVAMVAFVALRVVSTAERAEKISENKLVAVAFVMEALLA